MSLLAGIAVLRFPDTMSRIHAATKPQVLGIMLLMLGVGLRLGSPGVIGMLVLIVILQFVTAPVSAHLTVRVAFRNAKGDDRTGRSNEPAHSAADDGPAQMAQALVDENAERKPGRDPDETTGAVASGRMSEINDLSNAYVAEFARLSPMMATFLGLPGGEDRLDDLSPAGLAERARPGAEHPAARSPRPSPAGAGDDIAREVLRRAPRGAARHVRLGLGARQPERHRLAAAERPAWSST